MKFTFYLFIFSVSILFSCATNSGVSDAFSKYSGEDGVTTVTVPGWAIKLAGRFAELDEEERYFLQSIDKIKVLTIEDESLNSTVNFHDEFYNKINARNKLDMLVQVRDQGEDITILGKINEEELTELIILVSGEENTMVYLKGSINLDELKQLIAKSDLNAGLLKI
jgi:hypothetical protein